MKHILCEVVERNISTPEIFNSYEDAQQAMAKKVAEALKMPADKIMELVRCAEKANDVIEPCELDDVGIRKDEAYCTVYGQNMDWKIFEI